MGQTLYSSGTTTHRYPNTLNFQPVSSPYHQRRYQGVKKPVTHPKLPVLYLSGKSGALVILLLPSSLPQLDTHPFGRPSSHWLISSTVLVSFSPFLPLPRIFLCKRIKTKMLERPSDQLYQETQEAATGAAALSVAQEQPLAPGFRSLGIIHYVRSLSTVLPYRHPGPHTAPSVPSGARAHTHTGATYVDTEPNTKAT